MFSVRRLSARIGRRTRLAASGTCLLLALGSALAARNHRPRPPATVAVVVAARALPAGKVLSVHDLAVARWPPALRPGGSTADPRRLIGEILAGPLSGREAVTRGRLLGAGLTSGLVAGTVAVPVTLGVDPGALLHAGDRIDLVAVPADPSGGLDAAAARPPPSGAATVVASRALVLAVTPTAAPAATAPVTRVVLAADRAVALRIAGMQGVRTFAALVDHP